METWPFTLSAGFFDSTDTDHLFAVCRETGAAGFEGSPGLLSDRSEPELQGLAVQIRSSGLIMVTCHLPFSESGDISSFYEIQRRTAVERTIRWMEKAAVAGARIVIQHPTNDEGTVSVNGLDRYQEQLFRSLEALLPAAARLGLTIALENMLPFGGGGYFSRPEHVAAVLSEFGACVPGGSCARELGFCLDTGHALMTAGSDGAGQDREMLDAMAPALVAFHLQDNAGNRDVHLAPGRGRVDWDWIFRRSLEIGYSGTMCIEAPPFAPGPRYSTSAWQNLVDETRTMALNAMDSMKLEPEAAGNAF